jgi:DeoR/GlpR family transcriptional regulator of sugar metabolism
MSIGWTVVDLKNKRALSKDDLVRRLNKYEDTVRSTINWIEETNALKDEDGGESLRLLRGLD